MRRFFYTVLILILILGIVGVLFSGDGLPPRFVLELYLTGPLTETGRTGSADLLDSRRHGLYEVVNGLRNAARDDRIDAVLVRIASVRTGWATALEIRRALAFLEESGKPVRVLLEAGGDKEYLVACGVDSIFMLPGGHLLMDGIAARVGFLRNTLEEIGLAVEAERVGEYKNAPDVFTEDRMTGPHREALDTVVGDLFDAYIQRAGDSRKISRDTMRVIIENGPYGATEAMQSGIIDAVAYRSEILHRLGIPDDRDVISMRRYASSLSQDGEFSVAYIIVEGSLLPGGSMDVPLLESVAGSETIARALRKARRDKHIDGVLLRINSPGGSAMAADIIVDELRRTAAEKPVVVTMGDLAASGGYFIAAPAHGIVAESTTLTGSIGVYATKLVAEELYKDVKYTVSVVKRGKHADQFSPHRRFSDEERSRLRELMGRYYWDVFITTVSQGRNITPEEVDRVGRGRVWSGVRAKEIGLVDTIGGIWMARSEMLRLLELPDDATLRLVRLPKPRPLAMRLIDILFSETTIEKYVRSHYLGGVSTEGGDNIQSRLPFTITIH